MSKESEKLAHETRLRLRQQREARKPLISSWTYFAVGFGLVFLALFFGLGLGVGIILGAGALAIAQVLNARHRRRMIRLVAQRTAALGSEGP